MHIEYPVITKQVGMINSPPFSIFILSHFHFRFEFTIVLNIALLIPIILTVLLQLSPLFFVHPPPAHRSELHDTSARDTAHTHTAADSAHTQQRERKLHIGARVRSPLLKTAASIIFYFKNIEIFISYI
jgi:hypothetical protein